jgi:hypothetical protein
MKAFGATIAMTLVFSAGAACADDHRTGITYFGAGDWSCATWLATPESEAIGNLWITGYWSGRNVAEVDTAKPEDVGQSTDARGVVGEVKKLCQANPSAKLLIAADEVYLRFLKEGL